MSTNGETADLMVREGIQITERCNNDPCDCIRNNLNHIKKNDFLLIKSTSLNLKTLCK